MGPFVGVKVVEFVGMVPGPMASMFLSVLSMQRKLTGDPAALPHEHRWKKVTPPR